MRKSRSSSQKGVAPTPAEVKAWRHNAGLTQAEAAARIYVTVRSWMHYEAGTRRMRPSSWDLLRGIR